MKEGSDKANGSSFETDAQEPDEEFQSGSSFVSVRDLLDTLKNELSLEGYTLMPNIGGSFCGYSVYRQAQLDIPSLLPPDDFTFLKEVLSSNQGETSKFLRLVKSICEAQADATESKSLRMMWREVYYDFSDKATNMRTAVSGVALGSMGSVTKLTTLTGRSGYHRIVPQREWFPLSLRNLDARDLLTLLPDAEAKTFMLVLGRVMVGAKGATVAEGVIDHTARSYAILVGRQAGMGKSTLMGYLKSTLGKLGYSVSSVNSNMGKFGWGSVATSDLAAIDDLTDGVQKELISSNNIKSIVSNDALKVEEKGMPAVEVKSTAAVIGCTNNSNYSHYIGLDSGSISRLNQLDTYNQHELNRHYGLKANSEERYIKPYWEALAKEHNCTEETLAAWLLYQSAQLFLEVTGYTISPTSGLLKKDSKKDVLRQTIEEARAEYRIDISLKHAEELPEVLARLCALALASETNEKRRQSLLDNLTYVGFSPELLMVIMELFANSPARVKQFSECYPQHVAMDCKKHLKDKMVDLRRLSATHSVERCFNTLIGELKSTKSFGYPAKSSHYQNGWDTVKRNIEPMIGEYLTRLETEEVVVGSALDSALGSIKTYFGNIAQ